MTMFDPQLKLKFTVPSQSHIFSLPLAIVRSKLDSDIAQVNGNVRELKNLQHTFRRTFKAWKNSACDLLTTCGISTTKNRYGSDDLAKIAETFPDYHFQLYSRLPPAKVYSLVWQENSTAAKKVSIALFNGHYDVFVPSRTTIGKVICKDCYKPYKQIDRHKCASICQKCRRKGCRGTPIQPITCSDCNYTFYLQECYDAHRNVTDGRSRTSTCSKFKRCPDCNEPFKPANIRGGHICGNSAYCSDCNSHVNPETHDCCWIPPTPTDIQKKYEKQSKFKIVVYDFETVQLEDADNLSSYGEQWANYVCYSIMCHDCYTLPITTACNNCGPQRKGFFKHEFHEEEDSVVKKFMHFLLFDKSLDNATVVAHNASRFDVHFLIHPLLERGIIPEIVKNGLKVFQLKVPGSKELKTNNLKFKDSCLFLPMSLSSMPKAFGFEDQKKGIYPYLFNHPANYGKTLPGLPPIDYYSPKTMKKAERDQFTSWYEGNQTTQFDADKELHAYCENDVSLLHQGLARYMKASLEMTTFNPIVHSCTFASFSFFLIKHQHMKVGQVGILPENGYHSNDVQSKLAIKYIKWVEQQRNIELQYILRGGEHFFHHNGRKIKVDAYHQPTNTVIEVLGCWIHGCPTHTIATKKHPFYYKTMQDVHRETMERLEIIQQKGYNLQIVWEHDIKAEVNTNREMKKFFKEVIHHKRLIIRDAFCGARTQNYRLKAEPDVSKNQTIDHLDVNSMYPYILSNTPMPMGQPKVITSEFQPLTLPLPYKGFYMIDILPPTDLLHPIIPMRHNGKLIFPLCRSCALKKENVECTHTEDSERYLHTTVYQAELEKALEMGTKY